MTTDNGCRTYVKQERLDNESHFEPKQQGLSGASDFERRDMPLVPAVR
jgi:hypothetical protein